MVNTLNFNKIKNEEQLAGEHGYKDDNGFLDIGRIRLNRKKQKEDLEGLKIYPQTMTTVVTTAK